ncbi:MAG: hypothetical protein ACLU38_01535 [Dysosmobacter sp.]
MAEHSSGAFRTSIGGQALIEGILMRGPEKQAIVVRDQDGQLVEKVEELKLIKDRYPILGVPLIRGTVNFSGCHGQRREGADVLRGLLPGGGGRPSPPNLNSGWKSTSPAKSWRALIVGLAVLLGVGLSIFLFLVLPTFLTGGMLHFSRTSHVGPEPGRGRAESRDLSGVSDPLLQAEGHSTGCSSTTGRSTRPSSATRRACR